MGYTNSDVAHAWAHNLSKCYQGSNLSHSHGKLMSYSTCIGQRLEIGKHIVFILNRCRYSNSTSKHQCEMYSAIPRNDSNVHVFNIDKYSRGTGEFISTWNQTSRERDMVIFGLELLAYEYDLCQQVPECNAKDIAFSSRGFMEMVRWFEITKCCTINKLLKMKLDDFARILPVYKSMSYYGYGSRYNLNAKQFRKFLKMMNDRATIPEIVDTVNGKGTWAKYMQRTAHLREADRNRRLSAFIGYRTNHGPSRKIWGIRTTRHGSITKVVRATHSEHWIQYLLSEKHKNLEAARKQAAIAQTQTRRQDAKRRLERHCGMSGWENGYGSHHSYKSITSFNYNGVVIDFHDAYWLNQRQLSDSEYDHYTALSREEQNQWVLKKRAWMLEQLHEDQHSYDTIQARCTEQERIVHEMRERQRRLEEEKADYKATLLSQGDEGLKRLWHEGFRVSVTGKGVGFFSGGNVLLRVVNNAVETSKGIVILFEECKRLWNIIKRWHSNNAEFYAGEQAQATHHSWTIAKYQNDVLISGCHAIAYSEMEYVAKELGLAG